VLWSGDEDWRAGAGTDKIRERLRAISTSGSGEGKGEWTLVCTGHNMLKLFGIWEQGLVRQALQTKS